MFVGLMVALTVLVVLAVVAAIGYIINGSVPDDGDEPPVVLSDTVAGQVGRV